MTSAKSPPSVRHLDSPRLEALVETMFLAAFADGEIGDEERRQFAQNVESLTDRSLGADALDGLIARFQKALDAEGRAARLATIKERLGSPEACKIALTLTIRVVAADGIIRTTERELLLEVAEALDIDRDEAADLVKALAPAPAS